MTIIQGDQGGTGVNNGDKLITVDGNLTTDGGDLILTLTGDTNVTLPTSGTLAIVDPTAELLGSSIAITTTDDTIYSTASVSGGVKVEEVLSSIRTYDDTPTALYSLELANNTLTVFNGEIGGVRVGGVSGTGAQGNVAGYPNVGFVAKNIDNTVTIVPSADTEGFQVAKSDIDMGDITVDVNGSAVDVLIAGKVDTTIDWNIHGRFLTAPITLLGAGWPDWNGTQDGIPYAFEETTSIQSTKVIRLSDTSIACGYINNTDNNGYVVVGTISDGNVIAWGTPVASSGNHTISMLNITALDATNVVLAYKSTLAAGYGYGQYLTIDGTTVTPTESYLGFGAHPVDSFSLVPLNATQFLIVSNSSNFGSNNLGEATWLQLPGGELIGPPPFQFNNGAGALYVSAAYSGNGKVLVLYGDTEASGISTLQALDVNLEVPAITGNLETALAFGTSGFPRGYQLISLTPTKFAALFNNGDDTLHMSIVGISLDLDTNEIAVGTIVQLTDNFLLSDGCTICRNDNDNAFIVYTNNDDKMFGVVASFSGIEVTLGTPVEVGSPITGIPEPSSATINSTSVVYVYHVNAESDHGFGKISQIAS